MCFHIIYAQYYLTEIFLRFSIWYYYYLTKMQKNVSNLAEKNPEDDGRAELSQSRMPEIEIKSRIILVNRLVDHQRINLKTMFRKKIVTK